MSRRHARLTILGDGMVLEDLGSANGTFLGERAVFDAARLSPIHRVRLGDVELDVRQVNAAESGEPSQVPDPIPSERYAIGAEIARGGMGAILHAHQTGMDRRVAMKVMLEASEASDASPARRSSTDLPR
jgi:hypothetical protein